MNGKYNPKTKRYEDIYGNPLEHRQEDLSLDAIEREELRQIDKINAEGGTYIERYARELNVKASDLFKNILENNSMERFTSVKSYAEFKMLKQTLVNEENGFKNLFNTVMDATGFPKF